ncbi:Putative HMP/thiamine import ATP-binding protein YkoD [Bhargavaea cecembensis DSE10]|uniref:Putative HMP/thiamine import ATP-binding protein YkoD n=1 Tax=Bhargavaea cecembensis DSE10 TaxID=1235279 RepID=M7NZA8_9BACL|nr:ABC transporter ATP-binding protein [Bhargavaea cecembensis]EMR07005.1 Putative HMP/thiamine import ATP-binding protein YkoD [Bhargavaea cecembensis DSE10]
MHEPVVSLADVSFRFPDDQVNTLNGLTFTIRRGERVVISGPSGCGKSTLLYLLNRLYPLNCDGIVEGDIRLFGKRADDYRPGEINRLIATVFQDPDSQFCMTTVEEELAFTLENLRVSRADMERRIVDVLAQTGLTDFRNLVIQSLSGGQKQRVATACALVAEPEVLLLDEPLAHLDPLTARNFVRWLDGIQKQTGLTVIAVEHRLDLWEGFFEREIVLGSDGQMIGDHTADSKAPVVFPKRASGMTGKPALSVSDLSVEISGKQLLELLSFDIGEGEIAVIAGPNGSGKSTLAKALCGIYKHTGTVKSPGTGYVPQSPEFLFLTNSVQDELSFSGLATTKMLDDLADRLKLKAIWDAHPFAVSHGQKRRVAIGAMLADNRPVIIMDEPTSGQDVAGLQELFSLIDERSREGITFLIITHDMEFASAVADSVILIKDGRLTGKFMAEEVWENPALLNAHHLLPPKGADRREPAFA